MRCSVVLLIALMTVPDALYSQTNHTNREDFQIRAGKVVDPINIDGTLRESTWKRAQRAANFYRVLPIDTGQAEAQTEVMVAYDEEHLYMAIICLDPRPGRRPSESLRRDFSFGKNDNFLVFIDTYNDQTNGFSFGISAAGAQWDGLQSNGGGVSLDWDCKWRSALSSHDDRWIAEFAIPFRSIRYQEGVKEWGINFSRLDLKTAEKSSWAPVPRQFPTASLAFVGTLIWDEPPPKLGPRFSLIPYLAGSIVSDRENDASNTWKGNAGLDAKVTLSTSMNIDLTVNPDFSQVEVDRQVTNLDRFELFFPERRQFFLENSDLFSSLGSQNIRPFFSRRIGLNAPVHAGLRLSGKIKDDWRIGLMNVQTGSEGDVAAANFTVAAVQKKVLQRSNIGIFAVNKLLTGNYHDDDLRHNGVVGTEFNLASRDNRWTGKVFAHQSLYKGAKGESMALSGEVTFSTQAWNVALAQSRVGARYIAETGFVRRRGYYETSPGIAYRWYTKDKRIASHGPSIGVNLFFDRHYRFTDRIAQAGYRIQWRDRSSFNLSLQRSFIKLTAPFDPTNTGGHPLPQGDSFTWNEVISAYNSNARSVFNYDVVLFGGQYFNGDRFGLESTLNYRFQPYGSIGLIGAYHNINLPDPYEDADLVLIGPKLDITLTNAIFFTTFVQYNSQIENLNLNMRFQWRYAPVSDFFLVYSDNSNPSPWQNKNRALVAKLSYYFN